MASVGPIAAGQSDAFIADCVIRGPCVGAHEPNAKRLHDGFTREGAARAALSAQTKDPSVTLPKFGQRFAGGARVSGQLTSSTMRSRALPDIMRS